MEIKVVRHDDEFVALRTEWNELLGASAAWSVFLTWEWLHTWWRHFGRDKQLHILAVRDEQTGALTGIAPFCIATKTICGAVPVRKAMFLGVEKVSSDFLDIIARPGKEEEVVREIVRYFMSERSTWDVVELSEMDACSRIIPLLRAAARGRALQLEKKASVCPVITFSGGYDQFMASLDSRLCNDIVKKSSRLQHHRGITAGVNLSMQDVRRTIEAMFRLHKESFLLKKYGTYEQSGFRGQDIMAFHEDLMPALLDTGWLHLYQVLHNGEMVAFLYVYRFKGRTFCYQSGFDKEWSRMSLGTVLIHQCIRDSIARGDSEFHYLRGEEDYKYKWTADGRATRRIALLNRNWRAGVYGACFLGRKMMKTLLRRGNDTARARSGGCGD